MAVRGIHARMAEAARDQRDGRGESGASVGTHQEAVGTMSTLEDLETKAASKQPFTRAEAERVMACADLISIGVLGEGARKALHADVVTYGRVCVLPAGPWPSSVGEAGEVRIGGRPSSADDARTRVRAARVLAGAVPLTGFSAADLLELCGGDHLALAELARALKNEGLDAVAELPLDRLGETDNVV